MEDRLRPESQRLPQTMPHQRQAPLQMHSGETHPHIVVDQPRKPNRLDHATFSEEGEPEELDGLREGPKPALKTSSTSSFEGIETCRGFTVASILANDFKIRNPNDGKAGQSRLTASPIPSLNIPLDMSTRPASSNRGLTEVAGSGRKDGGGGRGEGGGVSEGGRTDHPLVSVAQSLTRSSQRNPTQLDLGLLSSNLQSRLQSQQKSQRRLLEDFSSSLPDPPHSVAPPRAFRPHPHPPLPPASSSIHPLLPATPPQLPPFPTFAGSNLGVGDPRSGVYLGPPTVGATSPAALRHMLPQHAASHLQASAQLQLNANRHPFEASAGLPRVGMFHDSASALLRLHSAQRRVANAPQQLEDARPLEQQRFQHQHPQYNVTDILARSLRDRSSPAMLPEEVASAAAAASAPLPSLKDPSFWSSAMPTILPLPPHSAHSPLPTSSSSLRPTERDFPALRLPAFEAAHLRSMQAMAPFSLPPTAPLSLPMAPLSMPSPGPASALLEIFSRLTSASTTAANSIFSSAAAKTTTSIGASKAISPSIQDTLSSAPSCSSSSSSSKARSLHAAEKTATSTTTPDVEPSSDDEDGRTEDEELEHSEIEVDKSEDGADSAKQQRQSEKKRRRNRKEVERGEEEEIEAESGKRLHNSLEKQRSRSPSSGHREGSISGSPSGLLEGLLTGGKRPNAERRNSSSTDESSWQDQGQEGRTEVGEVGLKPGRLD